MAESGVDLHVLHGVDIFWMMPHFYYSNNCFRSVLSQFSKSKKMSAKERDFGSKYIGFSRKAMF